MATKASSVTRVGGLLLTVVLAATMALAGCTPRPDGPEPAAKAFFDALSTGDTTAAADLTDRPDVAREALNASWTGLQADRLDVTTTGSRFTEDTGSVNYTYTWHLPKKRTWTYDGQLNMVRDEAGWQVRWSGTGLHPKLGENQNLQLRADAPRRASVNELGGSDVLVPGYRYSYQFDARQAGRELMPSAQAAVDVLRPFGGPEDAALLAEQASASDKPMQLVTLSQDDLDKVAPMLENRPGIIKIAIPELKATDPGFAPALISEVRKAVVDDLDGAPGWRVVSVNQYGTDTDVLHEVAPAPAPSVSITLDRAVQDAAQNAVNGQGLKAMMVVIRPSTGDILAVAQNAAADADGPTATMGLYPPGSTFKIITAGAAMDNNLASPDTMLGCPAEIEIGHRRVPNYNKFDLGVVPMSRAFADSCNTTFAELASRMTPRALNQTAARFGLGMDYQIEGLPTVSGSVPPTVDLAEMVEDGFGQGKVLASPFGMALAAATVAAGQTPVPRLIIGHDTVVDGASSPVSPQMLDGLRSMMRMVVTDGTAKDLGGAGDVRGKTGEAEFAGGSHAWFAGYRGDMAFASLIVGGGSSEYAVRMTRQMLDSLPGDYLA